MKNIKTSEAMVYKYLENIAKTNAESVLIGPFPLNYTKHWRAQHGAAVPFGT